MFPYSTNSDIKLCTPYVSNMLSDVTACLCDKYDWWPYLIDRDTGYRSYLQALWDQHETFINVEQDIIFWPGAIEALWNCPKAWCTYSYGIFDFIPPNVPMLGCTKITTRLMDKTPEIWPLCQSKWNQLDGYLWSKVNKLYPHQHFPHVINANMGFINGSAQYANHLLLEGEGLFNA